MSYPPSFHDGAPQKQFQVSPIDIFMLLYRPSYIICTRLTLSTHVTINRPHPLIRPWWTYKHKWASSLLSIWHAACIVHEEECINKGHRATKKTYKRGVEVANRGKGKSMGGLVWNYHTHNVHLLSDQIFKPPLLLVIKSLRELNNSV